MVEDEDTMEAGVEEEWEADHIRNGRPEQEFLKCETILKF